MSVEQRTGDVRILLFIESRGLKGQDSEIDIVLVDISICHHSQDAFNSQGIVALWSQTDRA